MRDALDATPYDALLLLSFGGPEGPDDVVPFLENVTRGRGIPKERLKEVGQHYFLFGGVSPINDQNRALLDALRKDFADHGLDLPVYWGNRNWAPYLTDTLREMVHGRQPPHPRPRHQRVRLVLGLPPVPREPRGLPGRPGDRGPRRCRGSTSCGTTSTTPASCEPMVEGVLAVPRRAPRGRPGRARTSPSPPTPSRPRPPTPPGPVEDHGDGGAYVTQHLDVARLIADAVRERTGVDHPWQLVYQSRSGAPHIPWLEPDICDHLEELHGAGVPAVVMAPDRLRLGPHGGPVRPRHGGHGQGRGAGPARAPLGDRGRRPALRRRDPRTRPGARRRRERAGTSRRAPWARSARPTTSARSAAARPVPPGPPPRAPTARTRDGASVTAASTRPP